jgi:hypothetical protein
MLQFVPASDQVAQRPNSVQGKSLSGPNRTIGNPEGPLHPTKTPKAKGLGKRRSEGVGSGPVSSTPLCWLDPEGQGHLEIAQGSWDGHCTQALRKWRGRDRGVGRGNEGEGKKSKEHLFC